MCERDCVVFGTLICIHGCQCEIWVSSTLRMVMLSFKVWLHLGPIFLFFVSQESFSLMEQSFDDEVLIRMWIISTKLKKLVLILCHDGFMPYCFAPAKSRIMHPLQNMLGCRMRSPSLWLQVPWIIRHVDGVVGFFGGFHVDHDRQ